VADDPLQPQSCARKLSALAAPERLRIIQCLRDGPRNVSEIAALMQLELVNVSHHLNVLHNAGLVQREKQGRFVVYSLPPGALQKGLPGEGEHLDLGCCRLEFPVHEAGQGEPSAD
jgi:DNA-binding transcriptional ArsR family regulator